MLLHWPCAIVSFEGDWGQTIRRIFCHLQHPFVPLYVSRNNGCGYHVYTAQLANVVGPLHTSLPIKTIVDPNQTFQEYFTGFRVDLSKSLENGDILVAYEDINSEISDPSRRPSSFRHSFTYDEMNLDAISEIEMKGMEVNKISVPCCRNPWIKTRSSFSISTAKLVVSFFGSTTKYSLRRRQESSSTHMLLLLKLYAAPLTPRYAISPYLTLLKRRRQ